MKIQQEENIEQPIQSCLIWPIQRITKYSLLLRELLECARSTATTGKTNSADLAGSNAESKIREALMVMEDVPRKANDAMHLALLQEAPRSDLLLQGPVILSERSVLPGVQKARERHCFLFETALIICKRNENKTYAARFSTPISKLHWDQNVDTFTIWGNGSRVCLKPIEKPGILEWTGKLKHLTGRDGGSGFVTVNGKAIQTNSESQNSSNSIPPPMAIFRSLPRPAKNKLSTSDDYKMSAKTSLEV